APRLTSDARRPRVPSGIKSDRLSFEIGKQATNAVISGVLSFFIPLFVPVALLCGARAMSLIEENDTGHHFAGRAKLGRAIAWIAGLLYTAVISALLFSP
ncbi:MAG: hypothetical protein AAF497_13945, partial [Planctomycetota bacterium]